MRIDGLSLDFFRNYVHLDAAFDPNINVIYGDNAQGKTNLGRVVDEFNAQCEGDEVEIGFNNRYLLDALRNARTEQVKLEISGPLSPVKVLPTEGSDFLYLVLPVRFKND